MGKANPGNRPLLGIAALHLAYFEESLQRMDQQEAREER